MLSSLVDYLDVNGLTDDEQRLLNRLLAELRKHRPANHLRTLYFDVEQTTRHFGIAVPPQFESVETLMGWPAKAVEELEFRLNLDGFYTPEGGMDDLGLAELWDDNRLEIEATTAHSAALKYGPAFVGVMAGDTTAGEPPVVIRTLSPTTTTGLWNPLTRRLDAALSVVSEAMAMPTEFILFLDYAVITARRFGGKWSVERAPHRLGRCPVVMLPFKPSDTRPMGRSRITKPVMTLTDHAIRTLLRMEIGAEFYSAPRSVLLGADPEMFTDDEGNPLPAWTAYMTDLMLVPRPEDPELPMPSMKSLPQVSMQPLAEELRVVGAAFSGETGIPVGQLGIVHDNPASDAAMHTSMVPLNKTAERAAMTFSPGWADVARLAVMVRDDLTEPPAYLRRLRAYYRRPEEVTMGMAADAVLKLASSGVIPADSDVLLEMLDLPSSAVARIKQDRRRAQARAGLEAIVSTMEDPTADRGLPAGLDPEGADDGED